MIKRMIGKLVSTLYVSNDSERLESRLIKSQEIDYGQQFELLMIVIPSDSYRLLTFATMKSWKGYMADSYDS